MCRLVPPLFLATGSSGGSRSLNTVFLHFIDLLGSTSHDYKFACTHQCHNKFQSYHLYFFYYVFFNSLHYVTVIYQRQHLHHLEYSRSLLLCLLTDIFPTTKWTNQRNFIQGMEIYSCFPEVLQDTLSLHYSTPSSSRCHGNRATSQN